MIEFTGKMNGHDDCRLALSPKSQIKGDKMMVRVFFCFCCCCFFAAAAAAAVPHDDLLAFLVTYISEPESLS